MLSGSTQSLSLFDSTPNPPLRYARHCATACPFTTTSARYTSRYARPIARTAPRLASHSFSARTSSIRPDALSRLADALWRSSSRLGATRGFADVRMRLQHAEAIVTHPERPSATSTCLSSMLHLPHTRHFYAMLSLGSLESLPARNSTHPPLRYSAARHCAPLRHCLPVLYNLGPLHTAAPPAVTLHSYKAQNARHQPPVMPGQLPALRPYPPCPTLSPPRSYATTYLVAGAAWNHREYRPWLFLPPDSMLMSGISVRLSTLSFAVLPFPFPHPSVPFAIPTVPSPPLGSTRGVIGMRVRLCLQHAEATVPHSGRRSAALSPQRPLCSTSNSVRQSPDRWSAACAIRREYQRRRLSHRFVSITTTTIFAIYPTPAHLPAATHTASRIIPRSPLSPHVMPPAVPILCADASLHSTPQSERYAHRHRCAAHSYPPPLLTLILSALPPINDSTGRAFQYAPHRPPRLQS
ncbi:hypothetical protein B0H12DRAFT_1239627 [Mycena haematopus]|nr:hypothetical protein B0H12DRAFT_1239627 [Mycena haematopus]